MPNAATRKIYSWTEARRIARGHGFESQEEFVEYECAGAYQLPKNPDEIYAEDWNGWDDWLGLCWDFERGRTVARELGLGSKEEYMKLMENRNEDPKIDDDNPIVRLPYRPDLKYGGGRWIGWDDWLQRSGSS